MSIVLDKISKSYPNATGRTPSQPIINDLSLEVKTGELFVLLGSSGSGKSTLLRLIAGLIEADQGRIYLHGRDVTHLPPQERGTGFVFQNYSLFKHMTVAENIEFGLSIRRASRAERNQRVDELLDLIDLAGYGNRLPSQLSGGQQQRVALVRALAYQPSVLLLDEPFGALDVKIRAQLRQNLRRIQQRLGVTAILVTHDQEEAFEVADRIGIIEGGTLLEVGIPSELYHRPQTPFTATFLGSANLLNGQRNGTAVHLGNVSLPVPPQTDHLSGQPVKILFRPEEVELSATAQNVQGDVIGKGQVEALTFAGSALRVTVKLLAGAQPDKTLQVLVTHDKARELALLPGQEVWVSLKAFHLLPGIEPDIVTRESVEPVLV